MTWRPRLAFAALLAASGCGGQAPPPPSAIPKPTGKGKRVAMITPARLVPELDAGSLTTWERAAGSTKYLVAGMRIEQHDGGKVQRASERFPLGSVRATKLPPRLGGGYLFSQSSGGGTRLWRAADWTAKLNPLTTVSGRSSNVVLGFDRIYLQDSARNRLLAVDPDSGHIMSLGQLPAGAGYGAMHFADGWRAVVDVDLRGPMTTFDAGATWRPLPLESRIHGAGERRGDPVLFTSSGNYRVGMDGRLQKTDHQSRGSARGKGNTRRRKHPLGEPALRLAVERGWPDTPKSAIVVHGGHVARVELGSGRIAAKRTLPPALERATCNPVPLGEGFGFVCGLDHGPTTIQAFVAPLGLKEVAKFDEPRFVASSGNGRLVVRGGCAAKARPSADSRIYCIISADGRREVGVRGDLGAERVVALADGRVAVLVPPRAGAKGRLTVIDGAKISAHPLTFKAKGRAKVLAERGMWLEGFEERKKGEISGWIEAGGPALGVTVKLDGKVDLGEVMARGGTLLASGRFALAVDRSERAAQSTDGGRSWSTFELPRLPGRKGRTKSLGCSRVGCALAGWLRVGWGDPEVKADLDYANTPRRAYTRSSYRRSISMSCRLVSEPVTPPPLPPRPTIAMPMGIRTGWSRFRHTLPPSLQADEFGVQRYGSSYDKVRTHVYVWGPRGANWARTGSWQFRFDDRFDPDGIRRSATTRPPFTDEVSAAGAIGALRGGGYWRWSGALDPGGEAALLDVCSGRRCHPYLVSEGRPIVRLRTPQGDPLELRQPMNHGVVRVGDTWYIAVVEYGTIALWKAEHGVAKKLRTYRRIRRYGSGLRPVRLVRRAQGSAIGFLVDAPNDPTSGRVSSRWMVLPIRPNDGALGEPVVLGAQDLGGKLPPKCDPQSDGWLVQTASDGHSVVNLVDLYGHVSEIEYRLRMDPGALCVDSIAGRVRSRLRPRVTPPPPKPGAKPKKPEPRPAPGADEISMAARYRYGDDRHHLACKRN